MGLLRIRTTGHLDCSYGRCAAGFLSFFLSPPPFTKQIDIYSAPVSACQVLEELVAAQNETPLRPFLPPFPSFFPLFCWTTLRLSHIYIYIYIHIYTYTVKLC